MKITKDTKLSDLLQAYPGLKEDLTKISDAFKLLQTPIGMAMANKATISDLCSKSGIDVSDLIKKLEQVIAAHNS